MTPRYNELEDLTSVAEFVVEASSFEKHCLWANWSKESLYPRYATIDWQECSRGWSICIGQLDGRPICITILGATLNGHHILFYEPTSVVVDWDQINDWFKKNCWPKWDNGTRRAHCDAMNFHHCLEVVE